MKVSRHDKAALFEMEFVALMLIIILGFVFNTYMMDPWFYFITLAIGFALYFWMIREEEVHKTGKKHVYFEHTSSFIMVAQTCLALELLAVHFGLSKFLIMIFMIISVIFYSVSISRIVMYKALFRDDVKKESNA